MFNHRCPLDQMLSYVVRPAWFLVVQIVLLFLLIVELAGCHVHADLHFARVTCFINSLNDDVEC